MQRRAKQIEFAQPTAHSHVLSAHQMLSKAKGQHCVLVKSYLNPCIIRGLIAVVKKKKERNYS